MLSGARLGTYEIVAKVGEGGMGEVYRAVDTKLGRAVAIKVLPDAFAADAERVPRFEREAKVLASLNHPHIAALYGLEEAEGRHFLIMELVEGETLADRLQAGALSIDETLRLAVQIADALDTAHEQGIVHRDLKPPNVKITPEGKVKVLDFGLARTVETGPAAKNLTHSPTLSVLATQAGMIMGTAAHMSPEQAKGLVVDRRTDVFSFGVVLYEMLTGRQPFRGETAAEVMASVMIRDADLAALPPTIQPRLRDIIARCLDKQPRQRWQSMGDLRVELEALRAAGATLTTASAPTPTLAQAPFWRRLLPIAAAVMLTAAATALVVERRRPTPASEVVRLTIPAADMRLTTNGLAIAPRGDAIAYTTVTTSGAMLMIRRLDEFEAKPVEATRGVAISHPAFSPDGGSVAFVSDQQIRRVDLHGGALLTICQVSGNVRGLSWHRSSLLFAAGSAIYRVADTGGKPEPVVQFDAGQLAGLPQMLDDDGTLLYDFSSGDANVRDGRAQLPWQVVLQMPSGTRTVLANDAVNAYYVAPGSRLHAQRHAHGDSCGPSNGQSDWHRDASCRRDHAAADDGTDVSRCRVVGWRSDVRSRDDRSCRPHAARVRSTRRPRRAFGVAAGLLRAATAVPRRSTAGRGIQRWERSGGAGGAGRRERTAAAFDVRGTKSGASLDARWTIRRVSIGS